MTKPFKRYKYVSKTFSGVLLDKNSLMGNMDEEATTWMNNVAPMPQLFP